MRYLNALSFEANVEVPPPEIIWLSMKLCLLLQILHANEVLTRQNLNARLLNLQRVMNIVSGWSEC